MIKDIPLNERPRERALQYGLENLSNSELLALLLRCGTKEKSVMELAFEILNLVGSINNLSSLTINKLLTIKGIGRVKAIEIMGLVELCLRMQAKNNYFVKISCSHDVFDNYKNLFTDKKQELFYCLYLNNKNVVIERKLLFMGTINRSVVHPREVFKNAYLTSASGIICLHNHPSGDVTPSLEDQRFTKALTEIGRIQNIPILDHIIIGSNNYYSFMENDLL